MNKDRLYKALKNNGRNKIVFAVPDRQDATELADDLFVGLANPELKLMRRRLNHLIVDTRDTSTTRIVGESTSVGQSRSFADTRTVGQSHASTTGIGTSQTHGQAVSVSKATSVSKGRGRTWAYGRGHNGTSGTSYQTTTAQTNAQVENESHSNGSAENTSEHEDGGASFSETTHEYDLTAGTVEGARRDLTEGEMSSSGESHSHSDSYSDTYGISESYSNTESTTSGESSSIGWSRSRQRSYSIDRTTGRSTTFGVSESTSNSSQQSSTEQHGESEQTATTQQSGSGEQHGINRGFSVTDQPGTRHIPYIEEDPEHWSLDEQRWRAAEFIMHQPLGHWFASTLSDYGPGTTPLPRRVYIAPKVLERQLQRVYAACCLTPEDADQIVENRRQKLLAESLSIPTGPERVCKPASEINPDNPRTIWNRADADDDFWRGK